MYTLFLERMGKLYKPEKVKGRPFFAPKLSPEGLNGLG